jgi:hypothetical protein
MLSKLASDGLVLPLERGWLLSGEPPGELLELQELAAGPQPAGPPPGRAARR